MTAADFPERTLSIPAELSRLPRVRRWAERVALEYGFDPRSSYQIKMATSEAVANAVEHGSQSADDEVHVRACEENGGLAFYVSDGGSFVQKTAPSGAMPERGRGLAFMDQLMDEVELRPGPDGTVIRLSKRRDAL